MTVNSGVYALENKANGRLYVGSAVDLTRRKTVHLSLLRRGAHFNRRLQHSFNKHGQGVFRFVVLAWCGPMDLVYWEQRFIDILHPQFNLVTVAKNRLCFSDEAKRRVSAGLKGNKNLLGYRHTAEAKRRISESLRGNTRTLGYKTTAETKLKISKANRGVPKSDEHKRKIGEKSRGRRHTAEAKLKNSVAHKGKTLSEETKRRIGEASRGRSSSAETRAKMSAARAEWWKLRRLRLAGMEDA